MVPSVALFIERARRVRPDLAFDPGQVEQAAAMVRRLDGMPLAIELAAGRLSSLGLADLGRRLDRALDVLQGATADDERHTTLRAAIEWSYDLLPEAEQRLFRHLAVFPDGVELDTAEALARRVAPTIDPTAAVAHLADASMLVVSFGKRHRYRMLDTLRTFGLDRLAAAGEHDEAVAWLLKWALDVARTIEADLFTEEEPAAAAILAAEFANLRAASTTARASGQLDVAVGLVVSLWKAAWWRELLEVPNWATDLIQDPGLLAQPDAATVFAAAGEGAAQRGRLDDFATLVERGLASRPQVSRANGAAGWRWRPRKSSAGSSVKHARRCSKLQLCRSFHDFHSPH